MSRINADYYLAMIRKVAENTKSKLTRKEFENILFTGDATGDGRLERSEIKEVLDTIDFQCSTSSE